MDWMFLAGVFLVSTVGTGVVRRYALARQILDVPNQRSSHRVPTPRGGGVAIVVSFLAGLSVLAGLGTVDRRLAVAAFGSGAIVAIIGFLDDRRSLKARTRLLAHFAAAAWAIAWIGVANWSALDAIGVPTWLTTIAVAVAIVWLLNLYNFMDGIDGIAGLETVTVALGAAVIGSETGGDQILAMTLAAAAAGFLIWNWPPARIFMGDAGSGFLGVVLAVLALHAASHSPQAVVVWLILLATFVVDATATLVRRLVRGERVYEAHRSHAYQHAAVRLRSHLTITASVGAMNALWLFPIALFVARGTIDPWLGLAITYIPLTVLVLALGAGRAEAPARVETAS